MPQSTALQISSQRCVSQQADLGGLLRESVDWERLPLLAEKNDLLPLVAETLAGQPEGNVAPEILERLAAQRKALKFRAVLFCDELLRLAGLFESKGLSVLHYKQLICSDALYGNWYRRTYFDLDFLVRRDELVSVRNLLRDEGYLCNIELSGADQGYFEREEKEYAFTDLHGDVLMPGSRAARLVPRRVKDRRPARTRGVGR